jgi:hypothetical protein
MRRKGKLSRQLKFGIIFAVAYIVLIAVLSVAASCGITGQGEQNGAAWILIFISMAVWYIPWRIGLISGGYSIFLGLLLTGLLVFGIGLLVGHIISIIVRHKAQNDLRP